MYFFFAILSMATYSLHCVWMAPYYRRYDRMVTIVLRGYALSIALLPGMLWTGLDGISGILVEIPRIVAASLFALIGNWAAASSLRYLPMGISAALNTTAVMIVTALLSSLFLGDTITSSQWVWIGTILGGIFLLGATKSHAVPTIKYDIGKGIALALLFGVTLGIGLTFIAAVSRNLVPLATAYSWETTIATFGAVVVLFNKYRHDKPLLAGLNRSDLQRIALYGIPGAAATTFYVLAVSDGPLTIVVAIGTTSMVATSVLAWLIHGERLRAVQWFLIGFVCLALIGMRCFS